MRVLFTAVLMALVFPVSAQQGTETVEALTVTVGANHAPPYRIIEGGEPTGLYVDIFQEIADRLGWKVHYREAPFRRVLRMVQQGEVDVMLEPLEPLETAGRTELMEFVAPAFPPERRLFFYLNAENRIERYADLYGRAIGTLEGASYFSRFDSDDRLLKEPAPRYENLMLMMQKGRVDVVIAPELVGLYTVEELGLDVKVSPFFVPGERSYIAVAKNSPVLKYADDIRAALKLIELEGIHEDLVLKYMDRVAE
ncbi:transporter substrate-binding domain-containing protein [Marinobacter sp.]|jgi:polar amino acid transport system substrate-binding protein|uniref:substrate-binding periplasmic protein n=2 Tax=unclassified Marinobacter TaxID=83889 RepID=UPI000C8CC32E|nr:transporter substrate-binding domain-containing protein [Marinobacter sp.]MAK47970.1 ABC transporter substrate-binding protein [Marinobacter sp.]|tara:strand:+ start:1157 stop:1918 length:762 start_codon:yes stop_codon:yes gene_type:complete